MTSTSNKGKIKAKSLPPDVLNEANNAMNNLLANTKEKYIVQYETFIKWMNSKNMQLICEDVLVAYFHDLSAKYKAASLWSKYSMLKTTLRIKKGIDIKTYSKLSAFIKKVSVGYVTKKAKTLTLSDIERFLEEAPDNIYLATKVALIFGVSGACRGHELNNLRTKDIENHGTMLLVKISNDRNKMPRTFTIHGQFYEIVKKYEALRSSKSKTDCFFQNYQNGKCRNQPIGVNKFGSMPKQIAKFLGLPDPDSYNGHSFRRTSVELLGNSGVDMLSLMRHSAANNTVTESSDDYTNQSTNISTNEIEVTLEPESKKPCLELEPSTSYANEDFKLSPASYDDASMSPTSANTINDILDVNLDPNTDTKKSCPEPQPSTYVNEDFMLSPTFVNHRPMSPPISTNVSPMVHAENKNFQISNNSKTVTYNFINCNFYNCFTK